MQIKKCDFFAKELMKIQFNEFEKQKINVLTFENSINEIILKKNINNGTLFEENKQHQKPMNFFLFQSINLVKTLFVEVYRDGLRFRKASPEINNYTNNLLANFRRNVDSTLGSIIQIGNMVSKDD